MSNPSLSRRSLLRAAWALPAGALIAGCVPGAPPTAEPSPTVMALAAEPAPTQASAPLPAQAVLAPTLECGDDDEPTLPQTAGPFYTPNTPQRTNLREPGMAGTPLRVEGFVLTTACMAVAGALVDFWQCDDAGVYDNRGFRLRGHQFTDAEGRYLLETIVPGLYPGRTRHIHVRVQAVNGPILTTQLYFPDEPANTRDGIFHPSLVMQTATDSQGMVATFNFVLA